MKEHTQLQHHLHPLHLWTKCGGRGKRIWKFYENHIWKRIRPTLSKRRKDEKKKEKEQKKEQSRAISPAQKRNASVW